MCVSNSSYNSIKTLKSHLFVLLFLRHLQFHEDAHLKFLQQLKQTMVCQEKRIAELEQCDILLEKKIEEANVLRFQLNETQGELDAKVERLQSIKEEHAEMTVKIEGLDQELSLVYKLFSNEMKCLLH